MKAFNSEKIKNLAVFGHAGCGKTTMLESMLFEAKQITRRGTVEDGNTVSDYHEIEQKRKNSVFSSLTHLIWKDNKINIIDTPGYDDFVGEVISALRVADTGIMVLNAQHGVEVGTELIWEYTEKFNAPMMFVVNQVDADKADFDATVEQAQERFGANVAVVQFPYNQGRDFNAIVDVLKMVMYEFPADGGRPNKVPIPADVADKAETLHNELVEAIAVNDEGLMELFFEKGELSEEEMAKGLKISMMKHEIFPLFCCSAKLNMGTGRVLGFARDIAPAAIDTKVIKLENGKTVTRDPKGDTVMFVFKTVSEAHLGDMSLFKVSSGTVRTGDDLVNSVSGHSERINQLYVLNGKNRTQVNELKAGDIGATVKLKATATNSTLHPKGKTYSVRPIVFPAPCIQVALTTENKNDMEKLSLALHEMTTKDPTLVLEHSKELKQILLSGQGELHLAVAKWEIENHQNIAFDYIEPKIPFRETIQKAVKSHYKHKKQSGGSGQFGEVHILVEPYYEGMANPDGLNVRHTDVIDLEWGGKLVMNNCIVGGAIDAKYMSAITKGILEKMMDGPLTGSYVRDIRVSVYDGKMHAVDSNDMAFKIAAAQAFKQAFNEANPQLMEPLYDVEVLVDSEFMGDIMSDLQTRRAMIMGIETAGHYQKVIAKVPLIELYKYSSTLRSLSQGRAKHTQKFAEYGAVPNDVQQKLVAKHQQVATTA